MTETTTPETPAEPAAEPPAEPAAETPAEPALVTAAPQPSEPPAPPMPPVPPLAPRPPRRKLRAAIRWTAAVLVFAALGGAATYAVTQPERTEIPGLKTPDDGRWAYPPIALPKLPSGRPRPLVSANPSGVHYTDERSLLLPLPEQAVPDRSFPGTTGWLPTAAYQKRYDFGLPDVARDADLALRADAVRHIAARAWTMPDGTRTEVYLVQFLTTGYRVVYFDGMAGVSVRGALDTVEDPKVQSPSIPRTVAVTAQAELKSSGDTSTRLAMLNAGDTFALVVQTRKGSLPAVPFHQTVRLQAQLLG
ncbi:hypothetical protein OG896_16630 [Streptomyces sp. NBC_00669]|uniref:hypothetical protein n=1 Tax=Streptomyces sp. NBC_00669 TaxID=2976011 RepID=UPI002E318CE1|nr:hypothetical protein [Streptomyces sp. NBC_00669]